MFHLPEKTLVVFDLETTDLTLADAAGVVPSVVELGAVKINAACEVQDTFQTLVRPPNVDRYSEFSERLVGIPRAEIEAARPWVDVWREFAEFTNYNHSRLVAWGTSFDGAVLRAEYRRARLGWPHMRGHIVCAFSYVYGFCAQWGIRPAAWNLLRVCERFDVPLSDGHRALPHADAVVMLLRAVSKFEDEFKAQQPG